MRADAIGLFWQDLPAPKKVKKEKVKRTPPARVWERPDYLPGLQEALTARYNMHTLETLQQAIADKEPHVYDIECYPNYFLIAFKSIITDRVVYFEMYLGCPLNLEWLNYVVHNLLLISFNGIGYDLPILTLALAGRTNGQLKEATAQLIEEGWRPSDLLKVNKLQKLNLNHIDLMEVCPGAGGLKVRAARLHQKRLQDLPFPPNMLLTGNHMVIVRHYCVNDLDCTASIYFAVKKDIDLRIILGKEYGLDLRSRSDPQIAEDVIRSELMSALKRRVGRPPVEVGKRFKYQFPRWMQFRTAMMQSVVDVIRSCNFVIEENGTVQMPWQLDNLKILIANGVYRMGIGGLHSSEKKAAHPLRKGRRKRDVDVTSFYPRIILNERLFPKHLTEMCLRILEKIVNRRINAKHKGDDSTAQTLKIVINGFFGKLGSMWSLFYAPEMLIQVTLTGQLSLLMLIEDMELNGISVLSANTDGIVLDYVIEQEPMVEALIGQWERRTGFDMESNFYTHLYSANVNNYVAICEKGKVKSKGWFAETGLQKNPTGEIIFEAVKKKLAENVPVEDTIRSCTDIRKFMVVRQVKGGAYHNGDFLGKVVRWYYSDGETHEMVYALSGNKVANSDKAVPMMELVEGMPVDLSHQIYIDKANGYLAEMGYS